MNWNGVRVLVTGAAGFIGSHLTKRLLFENAHVHILLQKDLSPWRIKDYLDRLVVWEADITDPDTLQHIIPACNPQIIFHLAGLVDVTRSWEMVAPMIKNNFMGTVNLLIALQRCNVTAFIQIGSSEEYGDTVPLLREDQREAPISPYSFSKVAATFFCQMAAKTFGLPIKILRLFPTYGPTQEGSMFIPSAIRELLTTKEFNMSPGEQKRDFIYVDDVVEACLNIAACGKANGHIFNVGSGISYKINEVIDIIIKHMSEDVKVNVGALPYRKGEGMEFCCDNQKIKQYTGWSPKVSLQQGLQITVAWYKSYYTSFSSFP
jgi:nucleoside-diphosphate-sugar epimerase